MLTLRRREDRGSFDHGWLRTAHTFSFADYHDPAQMGYRSLRVINEDVVAGGQGFGTHPHRDMEILTWVLQGALRHQDSLGNGSVIRPGDVQIMSAGTGIEHSEFNDSARDPVHLFQIWIVPERRGLRPRYDQRPVDRSALQGRLLPIAAPSGQQAVVPIFQDVRILATVLARGQEVQHALAPGRHAWLQMLGGEFELDGQRLRAGDGASIDDAGVLRLRGVGDPGEALLFDLA